MPTVEIYSPVPKAGPRNDSTRSAVPPSLAGAQVALIFNEWHSMARLRPFLEDQLRERYGVAAVVRHDIPNDGSHPKGELDRLAQLVTASVVGLGN